MGCDEIRLPMEDRYHDTLTAKLPRFKDLIGNVGLIPIVSGSAVLHFSEEYLFKIFSRDEFGLTSSGVWEQMANYIEQLGAARGYTKFWIQDF